VAEGDKNNSVLAELDERGDDHDEKNWQGNGDFAVGCERLREIVPYWIDRSRVLSEERYVVGGSVPLIGLLAEEVELLVMQESLAGAPKRDGEIGWAAAR
jgi:hypothetical protein